MTRGPDANPARKAIRQAIAEGLTDDDKIVARAIQIAGAEHAAMIGRVWARDFFVTRLI